MLAASAICPLMMRRVLFELHAEALAHEFLLLLLPVQGLPGLEVLGLLVAESGEHAPQRLDLHASGDGPPGAALEIELLAAELLQRIDGRVLVDHLPQVLALLLAHAVEAELGEDDASAGARSAPPRARLRRGERDHDETRCVQTKPTAKSSAFPGPDEAYVLENPKPAGGLGAIFLKPPRAFSSCGARRRR